MKSALLLRRTLRSSGVAVADAFTRADSTLPGSVATSGQTWDASAAGPRVVSNKLATTSGGANEFDTILVGTNNMLVEATISVLPTANYAGVVARYADDTHYYFADVGSAGDVRLYQQLNTFFTPLGTAAAATFAAGDRLGLSVIGSALVVYHNGSSVISVTNTNITTGTKAGVRFNAAGTSVRLDDFSASPA